MGRPSGERITSDVAKEDLPPRRCEGHAHGFDSRLGSHYVITVEAVNAQTDDSLRA